MACLPYSWRPRPSSFRAFAPLPVCDAHCMSVFRVSPLEPAFSKCPALSRSQSCRPLPPPPLHTYPPPQTYTKYRKDARALSQIAVGMFFFFAAGALGGITSLVLQNRPILERRVKMVGPTLAGQDSGTGRMVVGLLSARICRYIIYHIFKSASDPVGIKHGSQVTTGLLVHNVLPRTNTEFTHTCSHSKIHV